MFVTASVILVVATAVFVAVNRQKTTSWKTPTGEFPTSWRLTLAQKVAFFNALSQEEKQHFEFKVHEFLLNCRITGIKTDIDDTDRVLVAASAVIPILPFPDWRYSDLAEVLIYPGRFNEKFDTEGPDRNILGMVGTGYMEGKMILSQRALHQGFSNESDKKNTAIHEFVHLIDKADGAIDGVPELLLEKQYVIPWLDLMNQKIEEMREEGTDINPYGATNRQEFFAVTSEYFFERPKLLEQKHPQLYHLLQEMFDHHLATRKKAKRQGPTGRNSPCPCGSGQKFKRCCGKS